MEKKYPIKPALLLMKKTFFVLALVVAALNPFTLHAQRELLKDINQQSSEVYDPYTYLKAASNKMFLVKNGDLFVSTGSSFTLVKDLQGVGLAVVSGDILYFTAQDSTGYELWKSDGTTAGTLQIKDIVPGAGSPDIQSITVVSPNLIYFTANVSPYGRELWKSDGTAAGTVLVKDLLKGVGSSNGRNLAVLNNQIYFTANDGQHGYELWRSGGTAETTVMVKDIRPAAKVSSNPEFTTRVGNAIYFRANEDGYGTELWRTDGTEAGTVRVKDVYPGTTSSGIENLIDVNGTLFFTANDGVHGDELWKSNGTEAGTVLVKDLIPGSAGSNNTSMWREPMGNFTNVNGTLFYTGGQGSDRQFVVKSDGTEAGTVIVSNIEPVGLNYLHPNFTAINGITYYHGGYAIFSVDETNTVKSFKLVGSPDEYDHYYETYEPEMVSFNGALYVTEYDLAGWKLMKALQSGDSQYLDETFNSNGDSNPMDFVRVNDYVYFITQPEYPSYPELWRTDGTPEGTVLIVAPSYDQFEMEAVGGKLFFSDRYALYTTEGQEGSFTLVKDFYSLGGEVRMLTDVSGTLYFSTSTGELWKSDGTPAGTVKVRSLNNIKTIDNVNGKAFVLNENANGGLELWRTNTTGMLLVKTIRTGHANYPRQMLTAAIGSRFYFVANDGVHGNEIWHSDGTAFGTLMVGDINLSDPASDGLEDDIRSFSVLNGKLYVSALGTDGWKIFSVTAKGAPMTLVSMPPVHKTIVDEYRLYLFAESAPNDRNLKLWVHDDLSPGNNFTYLADAGPGDISYADVGGFLYFSTQYYRTPRQITACGIKTTPTGGSKAWPMVSLGSDLIFGDRDASTGVEPFVYHDIWTISEDCGASGGRVATVTEADNFIHAYPNPSNAHFNLKFNGTENEIADVTIHNGSGLIVETLHNVNTNDEYNNIGANWPKGIYLVKITKKGKTQTYRLVKN